MTGFDPGSITGPVRDLRLANGRLWVAGSFTHVDGNEQLALATVNPQTGTFDPYMGLVIAGLHNGGFTGVTKIDIDPDGNRLIAVGNFDTLAGLRITRCSCWIQAAHPRNKQISRPTSMRRHARARSTPTCAT